MNKAITKTRQTYSTVAGNTAHADKTFILATGNSTGQ